MKHKTRFGQFILATSAAIGLVLTASAQGSDSSANATGPAADAWGQLGSSFAGASYDYTHVESSSPSDWRGFTVDYNQPLATGLDFNFAYDWARADNDALRLTQHDLDAGLTAYTSMAWGKPFVQALAGWEHEQGNGPSESSFAYRVGAGVELQLAPPLVLTPFVRFDRATGFNTSEVNYGVKTAYRFNREWALVASARYDAVVHNKDREGYSAGLDYHF